MRYTHYSFDLWGTLIKSNPNFKLQREKYFHENFNPKQWSVERIRDVFTEVATFCNMCNETTELNIDPTERYFMVLYKLGNPMKDIPIHTIREIIRDVNKLFLINPPLIQDDNTVEVLSGLSKSYVSVISNTGFIGANVLRSSVKSIGLDIYIDGFYFSDEYRMSKPGSSFFLTMLKDVYEKTHSFYKPLKSIHIGDNPIADIAGAKAVGMDTFLINSNHLTIKDIPV